MAHVCSYTVFLFIGFFMIGFNRTLDMDLKAIRHVCTGWGPDLPIDNRYMLSTVCISMGGIC